MEYIKYNNINEMLSAYWVNHVRFTGKDLIANINNLFIKAGLPKEGNDIFNEQYIVDTAKWIVDCKEKGIGILAIYNELQSKLGSICNFGFDFFKMFYKQADSLVRFYEKEDFGDYFLPTAIRKQLETEYPISIDQYELESNKNRRNTSKPSIPVEGLSPEYIHVHQTIYKNNKSNISEDIEIYNDGMLRLTLSQLLKAKEIAKKNHEYITFNTIKHILNLTDGNCVPFYYKLNSNQVMTIIKLLQENHNSSDVSQTEIFGLKQELRILNNWLEDFDYEQIQKSKDPELILEYNKLIELFNKKMFR